VTGRGGGDEVSPGYDGFPAPMSFSRAVGHSQFVAKVLPGKGPNWPGRGLTLAAFGGSGVETVELEF